jgi:actin-related protein 10
LTDAVIEEIKTRCCFVGDALGSSTDMRGATPPIDGSSEPDLPPSDSTQSESEFSNTGHDSNISSQQEPSEFSVVSGSYVSNTDTQSLHSEGHLQALATMYTRHSTATQLQMRVVPPVAQQSGTGRGTLIIPGWIRERGAEVLFEGGDVDESSVAEVILDALLKVWDFCSHILK